MENNIPLRRATVPLRHEAIRTTKITINVPLSPKMDLYQDGFTKTSDLSKSKSASYRYFVVILVGHMDPCIRLERIFYSYLGGWTLLDSLPSNGAIKKDNREIAAQVGLDIRENGSS